MYIHCVIFATRHGVRKVSYLGRLVVRGRGLRFAQECVVASLHTRHKTAQLSYQLYLFAIPLLPLNSAESIIPFYDITAGIPKS